MSQRNLFLYDEIVTEFGRQGLVAEGTPQVVVSNLQHRIRPYQHEAFARFILWQRAFASHRTPHLLFNMATGSGKTLVMAGLMLLLYEQGWRNFLFFVHRKSIIQKTKVNFLEQAAYKYLFTDLINVGGREVTIREVDNFADARENCINIKFTSTNQLHRDLTSNKENGITLDDLAEHKIAIIADEAHNLNVQTKANQLDLLEQNWESTVKNLRNANAKNLLLEFTATVDYGDLAIVEKYCDKILHRYDLKQFRLDGYSKEINLFRSDADQTQRIIQALILNLYRQEIAAKHGINLKPVILFKAQKSIDESKKNKEEFHQLIDRFSPREVAKVRTSTAPIIAKAFAFFKERKFSNSEVARRVRENFSRENCVSANSKKEVHHIRLNTLEEEGNPLRAVFAVQKLNEGWDVLNLFDIVRLYETRDTKNSKPGKTTQAEAQLIGRGARYFPFALKEGQDRFKRKYDKDIENDLKILEELYYHTREDSRYISELKVALEQTGIYEDDDKIAEVQLTLKRDFKKTDLYNMGSVFYNEKTYAEKAEVNRENQGDLRNLRSTAHPHSYRLTSSVGRVSFGLETLEPQDSTAQIDKRLVRVTEMPRHVIQAALSANPFFWFDNLQKWFGVKSVTQFVNGKNYLGMLEIEFEGVPTRVKEITNHDRFCALSEQLVAVETEMKRKTTDFMVSSWKKGYVRTVFTDKTVRVKKEYKDGQQIAEDSGWYAYNNNFGTPEETKFVDLFARYFEQMEEQYTDIYLVRNERQLKIYPKNDQRAFEPDFLLFCKPKAKAAESVTYQIFIEPKGKVFFAQDQWKEDFLNEIAAKKETLKIDTGKYTILGLPFYSSEPQQHEEFQKRFTELLNLQPKQSEV